MLRKLNLNKSLIKDFFREVLFIPLLALLLSTFLFAILWLSGIIDNLSDIESVCIGSLIAIFSVCVGCVVAYKIQAKKYNAEIKNIHDFQWLGLLQDLSLTPEEQKILNDSRFEEILLEKGHEISNEEAYEIAQDIIKRSKHNAGT